MRAGFPSSPGLAPPNYHWFGPVKNHLRGTNFFLVTKPWKKVTTNDKPWPRDLYNEGISKVVHRWDVYIGIMLKLKSWMNVPSHTRLVIEKHVAGIWNWIQLSCEQIWAWSPIKAHNCNDVSQKQRNTTRCLVHSYSLAKSYLSPDAKLYSQVFVHSVFMAKRVHIVNKLFSSLEWEWNIKKNYLH